MPFFQHSLIPFFHQFLTSSLPSHFPNLSIFGSMSSRATRPIFSPGKVLGHYSVVALIGQGGYGDIYEAVDVRTQLPYAMKVERIAQKRQALQKELAIVRRLSSPYFPKFLCYDETAKYRYLIMELCGPSFSTLRRVLPSHSLSLSTVLRSGIQMLRAIESFHAHGFLHRDIKPSNFLIRASRRYPLALIDYGLSRVYYDSSTGKHSAARTNPGFVGTTKYASINAHAGVELGRRDDLFSWFYSLIELWTGQLPWSSLDEKQAVYGAKCSIDITRAYPGMPEALKSVYRLIRRLEREDEPPYKLLVSFICQAMTECGADWNDQWEWEHMDLSTLTSLSLIPPEGEEIEIPRDLPPPVIPPKVFRPFSKDSLSAYDARAMGLAIARRRG
jgi:serine/threonine protein kinase